MTQSLKVAEHLGELQAKIDQVAERAGVPAFDRLDLKTALAALCWPDRRRLGLVLESARVGATTPALHVAVNLMLELTSEVWAATPPPAEGSRVTSSRPH